MSGSSILNSVKKNLGLSEDFTEFDQDLIMHINMAFNVLYQLGAGPKNGFQIEDASATWDDFTKDVRLNMVKTYVYAKVRLVFDPPQLSAVTECLKETVREMESRISYVVDPQDTFDDSGGDENGVCRPAK